MKHLELIDGKKTQMPGRIRLPTTEKEIRILTEKICEKFGFKDFPHALFIICTSINHLPRDCGWSTPSYFADCVRRSLAAQAASNLGKEVAGEIQVREFSKMLEQDPGNMQVRDELQKLADRGVAQAVAYLASLENTNVAQPN